ncbi:MAG: hypothetical protein ACRC5M_02975 [Anaeroplasmataceae bacterium]
MMFRTYEILFAMQKKNSESVTSLYTTSNVKNDYAQTDKFRASMKRDQVLLLLKRFRECMQTYAEKHLSQSITVCLCNVKSNACHYESCFLN